MQEKLIIFTLISFILLLSCGQKQDAVNTLEEMKDSQSVLTETPSINIKNTMAWVGTYSGIIPCADCMGIQTELMLKKDTTFVKRSNYLGKSTEIFVDKGNFSFSADGNLIFIESVKGKEQYQLVEDKIKMLNNDEEINTELANQYELKKDVSKIEDRLWYATELMGTKVNEIEKNRKAYLLLSHNGTLSASGGCNSMFGTFTIEKTYGVRFGELAMSEKACNFSNYDMELSTALQKSQQYILSNNNTELLLIVGKAAPFAKFKLASF